MSETKKTQNELIFTLFSSIKLEYDYNFFPVQKYLEQTQRMILLQEKELKDKYDKHHEDYSEIFESLGLYEIEKSNINEFPNILNKSIYLTVYSMFENDFLKLCEWCQKIEKINLEPKDLKGRNYIGQCKNYIIKVLNVDLEKLKTQWLIIEKYQQIRNLIAHNNGVVKPNNKELLKFISETEGISIEEKSNIIKINSIPFFNGLIDDLINFLSKTIDEIINQKYK